MFDRWPPMLAGFAHLGLVVGVGIVATYLLHWWW